MANGIQKDLGKVTAYSYAKSAGYTGTEAEFQQVFDEFTRNAPGLITRMDTAVERAEAAVTEIDATVQDAVDQAVDEATASAVATANQAVTDAQAAQAAAEGAVTQANAAVTQANNAVTAAQAAQAAAEDAAESFVLDRTLTDSGAAAPADLVGDLKESISELDNSIFETETIPKAIDISSISGIVSALGMNGTIATAAGNEGLNFTTLATYDSYYIILEQPCEIWFEDADITSNYLAVLVGRNFTTKIEREGFILLKSSDGFRYRKNDGNLPTADNKLSLSAGDVVGFTMTAGSMSKIRGFAEEINRKVTSDFKDAVIAKPTYSIENGKIVINQKKARYEVVHCVDASIQQDVWRVLKCALLDETGGIHYISDGADADGVLKLVTDGALESDFVGGYHGDEILTDIQLYIDGNQVSLTDVQSGEFSNIEIWSKSNVYHVDSNEIAFERYKVISFDNMSLTIKNNFVAKETVSVAIAYLAMLSVERTVINSYYGNNDYKIFGNTDTVSVTPKLDHAFINTDYGVLDFEYKGEKRLYDGNVTSYQGTGVNNRLKWYFAEIHTVSSRPVVLNENDTIQGEYILKIS